MRLGASGGPNALAKIFAHRLWHSNEKVSTWRTYRDLTSEGKTFLYAFARLKPEIGAISKSIHLSWVGQLSIGKPRFWSGNASLSDWAQMNWTFDDIIPALRHCWVPTALSIDSLSILQTTKNIEAKQKTIPILMRPIWTQTKKVAHDKFQASPRRKEIERSKSISSQSPRSLVDFFHKGGADSTRDVRKWTSHYRLKVR
jgi:hypothetical protein